MNDRPKQEESDHENGDRNDQIHRMRLESLPPRRPPNSLSFATSMTTPSPRGDRHHFFYPPPSVFGTSNSASTSTSGTLWNKSSDSLVNHHGQNKISDIIARRNGVLRLMSGNAADSNEDIKVDINDLRLVSDLGSGTCGHVVKMLHSPTMTTMAVKQMRMTQNDDENRRILMDLDILLKCNDCPTIVYCLGFFVTNLDVWIIMELMLTSFDKLVKLPTVQTIPEFMCGRVTIDTLAALNYLKEEHGVIHRDVKPSNILINMAGQIKLCDFGISGRLVDSKAKTRCAGCAAYMAPERIDPPDPVQPVYDIRADVWSLGITLVELATGEFPYANCKTDFEVLTRVLQEDSPALDTNSRCSPEFASFVAACLVKDYTRRPKYRRLLAHPFVVRERAATLTNQRAVTDWIHAVWDDSSSTTSSLNVNSCRSTPNPDSSGLGRIQRRDSDQGPVSLPPSYHSLGGNGFATNRASHRSSAVPEQQPFSRFSLERNSFPSERRTHSSSRHDVHRMPSADWISSPSSSSSSSQLHRQSFARSTSHASGSVYCTPYLDRKSDRIQRLAHSRANAATATSSTAASVEQSVEMSSIDQMIDRMYDEFKQRQRNRPLPREPPP